MDEIEEIAEIMRQYIEMTQADPEMRGMWLLVLDLEVERIRLETGQDTREPTVH